MIDRRMIREAAGQRRRASMEARPGARTAAEIVDAALEVLDIERKEFRPGGVRGPEVLGTLSRRGRMIHVAERLGPEDRAFVTAHEIGHFVLHDGLELRLVERPLTGRPSPHGTFLADGYSERERIEAEADAFAAELLCPSDWLREQVIRCGRKPSEVARALGVAPAVATGQAIGAVLLPPDVRRDPGARADRLDDDAQARAATWADGALLLEGGPGSGKTAALAARIAWLVAAKTEPTSIVVLTSTESAAADVRAMLPDDARAAAGQAWIGTATAFGFEIIARNAARVGRTDAFRILDETGALAVLERCLPPGGPIDKPIPALRTILRAKRRLVGPAQWIAAAAADARGARGKAARAAASSAQAIGDAYARYEAELAGADAIDAADLSSMPVRLLSSHPDVAAAARSGIRHLLIDDLQDLEPAGVALVDALSHPAMTAWASGDPRQCALGFKGASPATVDAFASRFQATRIRLSSNHRASAPLARLVDALAAPPGSKTRPGAAGAPVTVADTAAGEAASIRDRIEAFRADGIPYRDQVVLARSHASLRRLASGLEALDVPLTIAPDLIRQDEVLDLLAVASLAAGDAAALDRVSRLPGYGFGSADAATVAGWARGRTGPLAAHLGDQALAVRLTAAGASASRRLAEDLRGLDPPTPAHEAMATWLFERSDYLARVLERPDGPRRRRSLASIHHLLRVAEEHAAQGDSDQGRLEARVRRAGSINQDTAFGKALPATAQDAVALMTIHAARGREFGAVHLAAMSEGYMPTPHRKPRHPAPAGLSHLDGRVADHAEGEAALLLIAASRARLRLSVSRSLVYEATPTRDSSFIADLVGADRRPR